MPTGKGAEPDLAAVDLEARRCARGFAPSDDQVVGEVVAVVVGLEADEIVMDEAAEDLLVLRQRLQDVRRRAGSVEEETDRVAVAARAQFARRAASDDSRAPR